MKSFSRLLLLFVVIFLLVNKIGAALVIPSDSLPPSKPWKISHKQFLDKYGKDDTSIAIINSFFLRRKAAKICTFGGIIVATGLGVFFDRVIQNGHDGPNLGIIGFFIILGLSGMVLAAGFIPFIGVCLWLVSSRKRLWKELENYFSGKGVTPKLKKKLLRKSL